MPSGSLINLYDWQNGSRGTILTLTFHLVHETKNGVKVYNTEGKYRASLTRDFYLPSHEANYIALSSFSCQVPGGRGQWKDGSININCSEAVSLLNPRGTISCHVIKKKINTDEGSKYHIHFPANHTFHALSNNSSTIREIEISVVRTIDGKPIFDVTSSDIAYCKEINVQLIVSKMDIRRREFIPLFMDHKTSPSPNNDPHRFQVNLPSSFSQYHHQPWFLALTSIHIPSASSFAWIPQTGKSAIRILWKKSQVLDTTLKLLLEMYKKQGDVWKHVESEGDNLVFEREIDFDVLNALESESELMKEIGKLFASCKFLTFSLDEQTLEWVLNYPEDTNWGLSEITNTAYEGTPTEEMSNITIVCPFVLAGVLGLLTPIRGDDGQHSASKLNIADGKGTEKTKAKPKYYAPTMFRISCNLLQMSSFSSPLDRQTLFMLPNKGASSAGLHFHDVSNPIFHPMMLQHGNECIISITNQSNRPAVIKPGSEETFQLQLLMEVNK